MQKLDRFDISILETLQNEGRISLRKLSEKTGLSQTPCHERIKRLEKKHLLKSYHTEIDISQVTKVSFYYVTVTLKHHGLEDFNIFERIVTKFPEVLEYCAVAGSIDYFMKIILLGEATSQKFMDDLTKREIGIDYYKTYPITKMVKKTWGAPLSHLFAR